MIDVFLLIIIIVMSLLVLATTFYQMYIYIHKDDKGWGKAVYCKVLVIVAMAMVWVQALLLPLDVASRQGNNFMEDAGINMEVFWSIVLLVSLLLAVVLLPYAIFLYETDGDESLPRRLLRAFLYLLVEVAFVSFALFLSWYYLRVTELPVELVDVTGGAISTEGIVVDNIPVNGNSGKRTIRFDATIFVYAISIFSFAGWVLLILFGGVGLFALPLDFIRDFVSRPKPREANEMNQTRIQLGKSLESLFEKGKKLKQNQQEYRKNTEDGWFKRFKTNRKLGQDFNIFKAQFNGLSEAFEIFQVQLRYADTNPLIPLLKLIVGVIFFLTSIVWTFEVILGCLVTLTPNVDTQSINFLNRLLVYLQDSGAQIVSTIILLYLSLFLIWSVQKGTIKMGVQIPFLFRFHPIKEKETWMNSFLFNLILLLLASSSVIQFIVLCLPSFAQATLVYSLFAVQVRYMRFYSYFYDKMIFPIAFVVWAGVALIYLLATCNRPPKYMREVEQIQNAYNEVSEND